MVECEYGDNPTLLMLSATLLKLFLSEEAQSWCWDVYHMTVRLDFITVRGNLNGQIYRQIFLEASVVPHFDNHPLNIRPVFMDDNARLHRAGVVTDYLRDKSITTLPWPVRSPDLNPIDHIWDIIDRRVRERKPPAQTLNELEQTLHQEWQRLAQVQIRRLVGSMRRRLAAVIRVNGSYTNY
jgi:hypothetical protein